jgi:glycosyltransferase involved in cell wall biosynthesis
VNSPDTSTEGSAISNPPTEVLVDVFIPVRNGVEYLFEAIKSVLNQTMSNFRLVVVDNNSTDGTSEIIRSFSDSRIETITHSNTLPLFENFNSCLSLVRAPFFCILHADDRFLPDYLEKMYSAICAAPLADLAYCKVNTINESGRNFSDFKYGVKNGLFLNHSRLVMSGTIYAFALNYLNYIIAPSVFFRSSILRKVGMFRTNFSFFGDLEYWQRGLKCGAVYLCVPQVLFEYRLHGKQETAKVTINLEKYRETLVFFSGHVELNGSEKNKIFQCKSILAQSRVALFVVWDYMSSNGNEAKSFREALVGFLLNEKILLNCSFFFRLLDYGVTWGPSLRKVIGGSIIFCVILPILVYQILLGHNRK